MKEQMKAAFAVVLVGALGFVIWNEATALKPSEAAADTSVPPQAADTAKLAELKPVGSISVTGVLSGPSAYDLGGRNLFQFGPPKPPPPSAAELEAMRKAEEARLRQAESEAKARSEEQQKKMAEENEKRARDAEEAMKRLQEQQKQAQVAVQKAAENPPPPPINYRLIGWLGPPQKRIAVFLSGSEIVLGRKGDVLDGKFRVLDMGTESVEMGYTDPAHKSAKKRIDLGS